MTATRDGRFDALLALAREGNADAVSDLFHEYGFDAQPTPRMAPVDASTTEED